MSSSSSSEASFFFRFRSAPPSPAFHLLRASFITSKFPSFFFHFRLMPHLEFPQSTHFHYQYLYLFFIIVPNRICFTPLTNPHSYAFIILLFFPFSLFFSFAVTKSQHLLQIVFFFFPIYISLLLLIFFFIPILCLAPLTPPLSPISPLNILLVSILCLTPSAP